MVKTVADVFRLAKNCLHQSFDDLNSRRGMHDVARRARQNAAMPPGDRIP